MELGKVGGTTVRRHDAAVTAIVGLAHRGVHAYLGGNAADDEIFNSAIEENGLQVSGKEGTFTRLINNWLARFGIEFGNQVVAGFATNKDTSHWARITDARTGRTAFDFGLGCITHVGTMPFTGVNHQHALTAGSA